jgi:L-malate glycosyltransferase
MKLLVVGHSYVTPFAQSKYVAMKKLEPNLQLRLVVPHEVPHVFMNYTPEIHSGLGAEEFVPLRATWNQSQMARILHPAHLTGVMKSFDPDHIHIEEDPHSALGVETVFLARMLAPRATLSFFIWDNLARTPRFPLNAIKRGFTRYSLARCNLVVCGNSDAQRLLQAKGYTGASLVAPQVGLEPEDAAIDFLPLQLAELVAKREDAPIIGFMGRLVPEKGVLLLLEALGRLEELAWNLLVVGNGMLNDVIRDKWQNRFQNRLTVLDAVPHNMVSHFLHWLDIFVLPSYSIPAWKEQFGLTLAQAMLAGTACIGSSCGAIPELLGSGGLIFQERNVDDLASTLKMLLESKALRGELGRKAHAFAMQHYTNTTVANTYLRAFRGLGSASPTWISTHA